MNQCSGHL